MQNTRKAWLLISRSSDISFQCITIYPKHIKICGAIYRGKLNVNRRVLNGKGNRNQEVGLKTIMEHSLFFRSSINGSEQKSIFKCTH